MKIFIIIFIVLIIGVVFINGYTKIPETFPDNLEIEYNGGACMADWGWNILKINSNGNIDVEVTQGFFKKNNRYNFTNEELLDIYKEIEGNKFFELKENYYNSNVVDGTCSNLKIIANKLEHKVAISNESVRGIDNITQKIFQILNFKDKNWKVLDRQKICNDANLACKTEDNFQDVPCDAWSLTCEAVR
jgi:hypothetical protein